MNNNTIGAKDQGRDRQGIEHLVRGLGLLCGIIGLPALQYGKESRPSVRQGMHEDRAVEWSSRAR